MCYSFRHILFFGFGTYWHLHCFFFGSTTDYSEIAQGNAQGEVTMSIEVSSGIPRLDNEVQLSYFANTKGKKLAKVSHARLIDITEAGLCMEVSLRDSGLFMESSKSLYLLCKDIELQIFCRSHPINISVAGQIKWYERSSALELSGDEDTLFMGVIFRLENPTHRSEILELVKHLKGNITNCKRCDATISADAVLCYKCGAKPTRRRTFFKKMIYSLLVDGTNA